MVFVVTMTTLVAPMKSGATQITDIVANVTDENNIVNYSSWAEAIEAAQNGDILKALSNIEFGGEVIHVTKSLKIDLNQHAVSGIYVSASDINLTILRLQLRLLMEKQQKEK